MEDSLILSIGYLGNLERVSQDKRACTLISCCMDYRIGNSWLNSLLDDKAVLGQGQSGASS